MPQGFESGLVEPLDLPTAGECTPAVTTYCPVLLVFDASRQPQRRSMTYTFAVAAHVLVLAAFFIHVRQRLQPVAASATVHAVTLAAPAAPQAPVAEKVAAKATPRQVQQREMQQRAQVEEPLAKPTLNAMPMMTSSSTMPSLLPLPAAQVGVVRSAVAEKADGKSPKSSVSQKESEAAAPPSTSAPSGALAGSKSTWEGEVLARLAHFRRYPSASRVRHEEGIVYIRFQLDRAGRVLSCTLDRSSGFATLDHEALATIARAQPLPAPPSGLPEIVQLSLPIEFFLH